MSAQRSEEEQDYSSRLYRHILEEVIRLDSTIDGKAGAVRPHIVREVLVDIAATIDFNANQGRVPADRQKIGELLGKRYAAISNALYDSDARRPRGDYIVEPETGGKPN